MLILSGADLVLPDRVVGPGTVVIDQGRIIEVRGGAKPPDGRSFHLDLHDHVVVPGFVDVHVHGVARHDVLDGPEGVAAVATRLPRYGVTAFCPTAMACAPSVLEGLLTAVGVARRQPRLRQARVLAAHLESSFISPEFRGAQPAACLRPPPSDGTAHRGEATGEWTGDPAAGTPFSGAEVVATIARHAAEVGIVTLAPELPGALDLIEILRSHHCRVSIGHSGAAYEEGLAAVAAGACHATHLFNCMRPFHHRAPGLVTAVLGSDAVAAEIICDGVHLHPAAIRLALQTKGVGRLMAITDATAAAGLPEGTPARLGGLPIVARGGGAYLEDGTLAGSACTMDEAFRTLVHRVGLSLWEAARLCATTPAGEMGLAGHGALVTGGVADLVILDRALHVVQTYVAGELAFSAR